MLLRHFATGCAALLLCITAQDGRAADLPARIAAPAFVAAPTFTWTGVYLGAFVGGGAGVADFRTPRSPSIYGGTSNPALVEGGATIGYNLTYPSSRIVIGAEADGGAIGFNGTTTCVAFSGDVTPYNCRVDGRAMATGTGRLGYAFGPDGRTLAYVKGGVAALFEERDLSSNNNAYAGTFGFGRQPAATFDQKPQVGFTVGAGLEQAISNAWSLKIEYDYADFGSTSIASPLTLGRDAAVRPFAVANTATSLEQSVHTLKVGLNYHLGAAPGGPALTSDFFASSAPPAAAIVPAYSFAQGYTTEVGARYWYSFGHFQRDLGEKGQPNNSLISRLSYESRSSTGELFGRLDTPSRLFLKGLIGAGGSMGGDSTDEDFLLTLMQGTPSQHVVAYSNTSSTNKDDLQYATIDIGYSFLESATTKVGGFVGYNHYRDDNNSFGCAQIANQASDCVPATPPTNRAGLTQNEQFNSLRLGVNGDLWFDRFRVQADAAYLPFVGFTGTDIHHNRTNVASQVSPEFGRGQGVQLELIASYYLTPSLSIGVGGRYWGFYVPNATTNDFGLGIFPDGVHADRYGVTAQLGYRFSSFAPGPVVARY